MEIALVRSLLERAEHVQSTKAESADPETLARLAGAISNLRQALSSNEDHDWVGLTDDLSDVLLDLT